MAACVKHQEPIPPQVTNPYQARAEGLARSGVAALDRGQWKTAQTMFAKSLQAATLADDGRMIALAWYNLGRARAGGGDLPGARAAYQQSRRQAEKVQDAVNRQRAALALALLEHGMPREGQGDVQEDALLVVPASFPVDVHLAAARLAWLRGKSDLARKAYSRVLAMAGPGRYGRIYAARAHLGLARLIAAESGQDAITAARRHLDQAIELIHRAGEPRLMLQALQLAADMEPDPALRQAWQQRAAAVRKALHEARSE
jgi:tetratricopeptide (TPR) repeat protein